MSTEPAVLVRGLRKSYGPVEAVRGVDLTVRRGEIFGLIGPNGAGKTTTLEVLEGYRDADAGEVRVLGYDPGRKERAFRERIGIVLQTTSMPRYLRVEEAIDMFRGYYPHPRPLDEVLEIAGLTKVRRKLIRRLSGGQQRRLDVGLGLAGDPDLLFLDEPTTGFDPAARRAAWGMIRDLKALGKTIVLTTHYMEEAQSLADRVAFIHAGQIVAEGTPAELRGTYDDVTVSFRLPEGIQLPDPSAGTAHDDGAIVIHTANPTQTLHALTTWALGQGIELGDLAVAPASLEDVYMRLSGGVRMRGLALALRQVQYENRAFWRNPAAAFFTVILPLMFLVLFNAIFEGDTVFLQGADREISAFYVPGIAALCVISACYTNIGMMVSIQRDDGVLKRVRGTPLPAWAYLFGRIVQAIFVAFLLVAIVTIAGNLLYGIDIPTDSMPALIVTVLIGAASFCALGLAITALIPNADAAPAITNGTVLPLLFISEVFIPQSQPPDWLNTLGNIFPVKPFAEALQTVYNTDSGGSSLEWEHLAVIAVWGLIGVVVALRYFTWEPRR